MLSIAMADLLLEDVLTDLGYSNEESWGDEEKEEPEAEHPLMPPLLMSPKTERTISPLPLSVVIILFEGIMPTLTFTYACTYIRW